MSSIVNEGECDFSTETKSKAVAALNVNRIKDICHLGFAILDVDRFKIQLCEFKDDAQLTLLEAALLQTRPMKCIVKLTAENLIDKKRFHSVVNRCGVTLLQGNQNDFNEAVEVNDIQRLVRDSDQNQFLANDIQELKLALRALRCVLKESLVFQDVSFYKQFSLSVLSMAKFMRLDKAAFSALNLLPPPGERLKSPTSLLGLLNKCRTQFGQNRLMLWITQPSLNQQEINERHDIVQIFVTHTDLRKCLQQDHFRSLPNLDQLTTKFHKAALKDVTEISVSLCSLEDLYSLHIGLLEIHGVLGVLELTLRRTAGTKEAQTLDNRFVNPLRRLLEKLKIFHDLIEYTFDKSEISKGNYSINRQFDTNLKELADQKDSLWTQIEKHRMEVEDDLGLSSGTGKRGTGKISVVGESQAVRIVECSSNVFVFRVTKKDQRKVQDHRSRYQQIRINKAEFQFTTKMLTILASEFHEVTKQFEKQQQRLAQKTISAASTYWPVLESVSDLIGSLDILIGFAEVASNATSRYVRPIIHSNSSSNNNDDLNKKRVLKLVQCRHPLVELQLQLHRSGTGGTTADFISNSICMEFPNRILNIITGPNMGGKSTYIRAIAMSCLMAQIGSYVPCEFAELSLMDSILCRVGASDDQLRGISTFLAEMIEATAITKSATSNSLVLIDELGRGTSTFEGFGLAWAIAQYLACKTRCITLFATHFHELGDLEDEVPEGVFNSQVTASIDTNENRLVFLFGVKPGRADLSYGVKVAEMTGLNPSVVSQAKAKASELEAAEDRISRKRRSTDELSHRLVDIKRVCHLLSNCIDNDDDESFEKTMKICFDNLEIFDNVIKNHPKD